MKSIRELELCAQVHMKAQICAAVRRRAGGRRTLYTSKVMPSTGATNPALTMQKLITLQKNMCLQACEQQIRNRLSRSCCAPHEARMQRLWLGMRRDFVRQWPHHMVSVTGKGNPLYASTYLRARKAGFQREAQHEKCQTHDRTAGVPSAGSPACGTHLLYRMTVAESAIHKAT